MTTLDLWAQISVLEESVPDTDTPLPACKRNITHVRTLRPCCVLSEKHNCLLMFMDCNGRVLALHELWLEESESIFNFKLDKCVFLTKPSHDLSTGT